MLRIDLHVHALERSACAGEYQEEMIQAAIQRGLHGVAFADHNRLITEEELAQLNGRYAPFKVYGGIEVDASGEHLLVFGVRDARIESATLDYPSLHRLVRERKGYMILAHPFRYADSLRIDIEALRPDGVEVHSNNTRPGDVQRIVELAQRLNLHTFSNSDGHGVRLVGGFYNDFAALPANDAELLAALKGRTSTPGLCRKWMKPEVARAWFPERE